LKGAAKLRFDVTSESSDPAAVSLFHAVTFASRHVPVAALVFITCGIAALILAGYMALPVAASLPDSWPGLVIDVALAVAGTLLVYRGVRRVR
jgi:hypothetical protein